MITINLNEIKYEFDYFNFVHAIHENIGNDRTEPVVSWKDK